MDMWHTQWPVPKCSLAPGPSPLPSSLACSVCVDPPLPDKLVHIETVALQVEDIEGSVLSGNISLASLDLSLPMVKGRVGYNPGLTDVHGCAHLTDFQFIDASNAP